MRNTSRKYVPVLHRMFYVSTHSSNSMWLALCLYNLSTDPTMNCMVINSANGQAIELENRTTAAFYPTGEGDIEADRYGENK